MSTKREQRRLSAILSADVAGYSRLMGADASGTLAALKALRHDIIDPTIAAHAGRIVKLMGDGILVEFASVVDAVNCAIEWQQGMGQRNIDLPDERRMQFRIGVNLGDVIVEDDDIYGDGVNLAARIQEITDPGGIRISRSARDQIRDKLQVALEDLGAHEVKNIARPIRVFRVPLKESRHVSANPDGAAPSRFVPRLELPDRPSIAVLPLDNMSGDPEQEYFSDGITEDIITELSKFPDLFVIARNSVFTYKGKPAKVQDIAEELGVRYVLEGSVRKAGDR